MASMVTSLYVFGTAILVLTFLLLAAELAVIYRAGRAWDDWNSCRMVCITFIVGVGGFLVVAGYSSNQMGAIFGLMGSIVGFMFGRGSNPPP